MQQMQHDLNIGEGNDGEMCLWYQRTVKDWHSESFSKPNLGQKKAAGLLKGFEFLQIF